MIGNLLAVVIGFKAVLSDQSGNFSKLSYWNSDLVAQVLQNSSSMCFYQKIYFLELKFQ